MKIMGKIVSGILATILLTAAILLILDVPSAQWTVEQMAALGGNTKDLDTEDDTDAKEPSIGTGERQIVYQTHQGQSMQQDNPQLASDQTDKHTDNQQDNADGTKAHDSNCESDGQMQNNRKETKQQLTHSAKSSQKQTAKNKSKEANSRSFQTVTQDYFSDALFIGDSRTVGMQQSGLLPNATYYAKVGIGIGEILSQRIVYEGGTMLTVREALERHSFGKVYLMIGINDMSSGDKDWFVEQYQEILHVVRSTQPNALIYIQGNIPMSYAAQDLSGSLNNQNLAQRNEKSRQLADQDSVFYLDIASVYADANGHLHTCYTSDGLHIVSRYYPLWVNYLMQHAIVL